MELLFVVLISAAIGLTVRYLLRGHGTYGAALLPAVSAAVASVVWVALLWLGWTFDGTWIWVASFVLGGVAALAIALVLPRKRREADHVLLSTLSGVKAR